MHRYFIIHKPYNMLSQFTREGNRTSLKDLYNFPSDVYPLGRLDADSEGLLILTSDTQLNNLLLNPAFKHKRTYLVQVEGEITDEALDKLSGGIAINVNGKILKTLPAIAEKVQQPGWLTERNPPVRYRKSIPTSFLTLTLNEGKNHQVRKMTAATGFPTLRLIRIAIEQLQLEGLRPGEVKELGRTEFYRLLKVQL